MEVLREVAVEEKADGHGVVVVRGRVFEVRDGEGIEQLRADVHFVVVCGIDEREVDRVGTRGGKRRKERQQGEYAWDCFLEISHKRYHRAAFRRAK